MKILAEDFGWLEILFQLRETRGLNPLFQKIYRLKISPLRVIEDSSS